MRRSLVGRFTVAIFTMSLALMVPAVVSANAVPQWVVGPAARAVWSSRQAVGDNTQVTNIGIVVYDQAVSPDREPAPLAVVYQDTYLVDGQGDWVADVSLLYGSTSAPNLTIRWPQLAVASGSVEMRACHWNEFGTAECAGPVVQTVAFAETWTGYGAVINFQGPAFSDKVSPFEHHLYKYGSVRRDAVLSAADPFAGAFALGEFQVARLIKAVDHITDVCQGGTPDPNTGACP